MFLQRFLVCEGLYKFLLLNHFSLPLVYEDAIWIEKRFFYYMTQHRGTKLDLQPLLTFSTDQLVVSVVHLIYSFRFKQSVYKLLGEYEAQDVITAGRYAELNNQ